MGNQIASRFKVIDLRTGQEVTGVFVLCPEESDLHRCALSVVAEGSRSPRLARTIREWLRRIHDNNAASKRKDLER